MRDFWASGRATIISRTPFLTKSKTPIVCPFPLERRALKLSWDVAMEPAVELESLAPPARKILDPASPAPLRQMAAKGLAPGLKPGDALTVVALLTESAD